MFFKHLVLFFKVVYFSGIRTLSGVFVTAPPEKNFANTWRASNLMSAPSAAIVSRMQCGDLTMVAQRRIVPGEDLTHVYAPASDSALLCQCAIPPWAVGQGFVSEAGLEVHLTAERPVLVNKNEAR